MDTTNSEFNDRHSGVQKILLHFDAFRGAALEDLMNALMELGKRDLLDM